MYPSERHAPGSDDPGSPSRGGAPEGPEETAGEAIPPASGLPLDGLERAIADLGAEIAAATCRWLLLIAEFARRDGHERHGFASAPSWLAWRCGLTTRAAREQVRVARSLESLPRIRARFASGELSYSKVRALTRVAEPETEPQLLELADAATAAQLEVLLRRVAVAMAGGGGAGTRAERFLSLGWEDDGSLRVSGSLPAEEGALLMKAIQLGCERLAEGPGSATGSGTDSGLGSDAGDRGGRSRPTAADALLAIAESSISSGLKPAPDRHQVVVHVDAGVLDGAEAGAAAVEPESAVGAETSRRLACDSSIVTLVERDGRPVSVGRKTRVVPPALRRALLARDGGCRFPGCTNRRFVDAHHIQHWARGGETSERNLVMLCRRHHTLVHEAAYSVEWRGSGLVFRRPNGREVEPAPRLPGGKGVGPRRAGRRASRSAPISRLDLEHAVFVTAAALERARGPTGPHL